MRSYLFLLLIVVSQVIFAEMVQSPNGNFFVAPVPSYYSGYKDLSTPLKVFDDDFFSSSQETYKGNRIYLPPKEIASKNSPKSGKRMFEELPKLRQRGGN
jgi:hypothetical protein